MQAQTLLLISPDSCPYYPPFKQVLNRPETSGRLMRWSIELSQYEIRYFLEAAIKGQAVVDFIAELMPNEKDKESLNLSSLVGEPPEVPLATLT